MKYVIKNYIEKVSKNSLEFFVVIMKNKNKINIYEERRS